MGSLWLDHEPSIDEIKAAVDAFDWSGYDNAIFCGFGEPTCALNKLLETAAYIKNIKDIKIRLNTNGLSDLINKCDNSAEKMAGLIDSVSISLNAPDAQSYENIVHPIFGIKSFDAMIKFTKDCQKYIPSVKMTVVDTIGEEAVNKCIELCKENHIDLKVRTYIN